MENNRMSEEEKREIRRKRRQKNQIAAYISLAVILAAVAAGIIFGVRTMTKNGKEDDKESTLSQEDNRFEDLLGEEPTIELQPEPTETIPEPTPEERLDEIINAAIEVMPLEDKVAGLFLVTPESITGVDRAVKAGESTKNALNKYAVGGIVYFAQNIKDSAQLLEMIDNTSVYSKYPLFFAVDEEGGSVSRLAGKKLAEGVESPRKIGQSGDADAAYQAGTTVGAYLADFGFNLDFAPVADVANIDNSIMKDRSYGSDAQTVSPFVLSMMQGLEEQGVTACLKHFPGLGSTAADTHDGLVVIDRTAEEFRADEFVVFQAGIEAGANMIMVSHAAAPALTGDNTPSSMSPVIVTDILRGELDFDGVIITDAMNMKAVSEYYEADVAAITALKAGCDMILMPDDFEKAYNGVLKAVQDGVISEDRIMDSLRRIYRIKYAGRLEG